jgi:hypothetical protein
MSLSKREVLERKKKFLSKHNILTTEEKEKKADKRVNRRKTPSKKTPPSTANKNKNFMYEMSPVDIDEDASKACTTVDVSSLDLIDSEHTVDMFEKREAALEDAVAATSTPPPVPLAKTTTRRARAAVTPPSPPVKTTSTAPNHMNMGLHSHVSSSPSKHASQQQRQLMRVLREEEVDTAETMAMIKTLMGELRYYEQLSGRRSAFDTTELEITLDGATVPGAKLSVKTVQRYLVQLVSQSMTYLLSSAIEEKKRTDAMEALEAKVETLTKRVDGGLVQSTPPSRRSDATMSVMDTPVADFRTLGEDFRDGHLGTLSPVPFSTSFHSPVAGGSVADDASAYRGDDARSVADESEDGTARMTGTSASDWLFSSLSAPQSSSHAGSPIATPLTPSWRTNIATPGAPIGKQQRSLSEYTPVEDSMERLHLGCDGSSSAAHSPPRMDAFDATTPTRDAARMPMTVPGAPIKARFPGLRDVDGLDDEPSFTALAPQVNVPSPEAPPQHPYRRATNENPYSPSRYIRQSLGTYVDPDAYLNDKENSPN